MSLTKHLKAIEGGFPNPCCSFVILLGLISFLNFGCVNLMGDGPGTLSGLPPLVFGHGGSGFESATNGLPSNTIASCRNALEIEDADGVEIDVQLSADSVVIIFHDDWLDTKTNCEGCIPSLNSEYLLACRYRNTPMAVINGNFGLPRLEELLLLFTEWPKPPLISVNFKPSTTCPGITNHTYEARFARALAQLVMKHQAQERVIIEGYSLELLLQIQKTDPGLRLMLDSNDFETDFQKVLDHDLEGIVISNQNINPDQVSRTHAAGKLVVLFGIKIRRDAVEAWNKGADMVQVDDIRMVQTVFSSGK